MRGYVRLRVGHTDFAQTEQSAYFTKTYLTKTCEARTLSKITAGHAIPVNFSVYVPSNWAGTLSASRKT
jgi:hypothetical protein